MPPNVDCASRIVESELARYPDNVDVLGSAGYFLLGRGESKRAIALFQKRAGLERSDASAREEVGLARLFQRDFNGARQDFAAAAKLDPTEHTLVLIGACYFLEGNYAEASKIFSKLQSTPEQGGASIIILNYVALMRMGRRKQAEAYLSDQMAHFVGSEEDHLMLLRATGRVEHYTPNFTDSELEDGTGVFFALVRGAKGDRAAARQALTETVKKLAPSNPMVLGATIELERLDAAQSKETAQGKTRP